MYQDFSARALPDDHPQSAATSRREEAGKLLRRYPHLSEGEVARLIELYRQFSALDKALTLSDEKLAPKFELFAADHRSKIRTPFRQYAALLVYLALTIIAIAWAASAAS
jgi:hypothetical protein